MSLLSAENFQDLSDTFLKIAFELGNTPGIFPEQPGHLYGVTERIHLKLSLPYPGILIRIILFPAGAAWGRVEGIGVRIDTNIPELPLYQPCYDLPDLPVFLCQKNIRPKLGCRIPQPHSGNIPGDHMSSSVFHSFHRSIQRIGITVLKQFQQFRFVFPLFLQRVK